MMMMKDVSQQCFIPAAMFFKHAFFGMCLFLIVMYRTSADGDLDREKCSSKFRGNQRTALCISMARDHWSQNTEICGRNDLIQILDFLLHIPLKNAQSVCDTSPATFFHYNTTFDISCLMKASKKQMKKLLEQIMEGFSGKTHSEVNSSHIMDEFISNELFGLPEFTLLDLNYTCFNKEDGIIPYVDMCDNVNVTDDAQIHTAFNMTSYSKIAGFPGCSCVITSTRNESVSVRAIDVRLVGDTRLSLSAEETIVMDSSKLYWWEDGVLISSPGKLVLDLTNFNPSELPHSVWLHISGHDLSIRCGNYTLQSLDLVEDIENNLWYVGIVGIIAGILVSLLLLATFLWRCVCRRSRVNKEYAVVCPKTTSQEVISSRVPNKPVQNEDESIYRSLASNVYFEVEPNYTQTQTSCSTTNNVKMTADIETCQDLHRTNSSINEDVYSHLRDTSNINPVTDVYDTIDGHEYSTLQRQILETVIDNVYNT